MSRSPRTQPRKEAQQSRSKATVEALIQATALVLVREGYDRASTNRIASAAGVNISSLYQYFPSKEALVAALVDRHLDEIQNQLGQALMASQGKPLVQVVGELARAFFGMHTANPQLHRVILEQVPRIERLNPALAFRRRMAEQMGHLFAARREELTVADPVLAAMVVVTVVDSLKQHCLLAQPELLGSATFLREVDDLLGCYLSGERTSPEPRTRRR